MSIVTRSHAYTQISDDVTLVTMASIISFGLNPQFPHTTLTALLFGALLITC